MTPGQGTCPGCGFGPRLGCVWEAALGGFSPASVCLSHINVSLPLFLPPFPCSLKSIKSYNKKTFQGKRKSALMGRKNERSPDKAGDGVEEVQGGEGTSQCVEAGTLRRLRSGTTCCFTHRGSRRPVKRPRLCVLALKCSGATERTPCPVLAHVRARGAQPSQPCGRPACSPAADCGGERGTPGTAEGLLVPAGGPAWG